MTSNIVHISRTPLVGAPGAIVVALNNHTKHNASWIFLEEYPEPLKGKFGNDAILFSKQTEEMCKMLIENANVIHIHNALTQSFIDFLHENKTGETKFVYQVHNARREGPVFFNMEDYMSFDFSAKLVVAQHQPRSMQNYVMVPNVVNIKPSINFIEDGEIPKLLFLPSHKRNDNRWGQKTSEELEETLKSLHKLKMIELISPQEKLSYNALTGLRKHCHISFDEIFSGSFHRVTMEAFACGNVAINGADDISILTMQSFVSPNQRPPFYYVDQQDISEGFVNLINNKAKIRELQKTGYDYFNNCLMPEILIQHYCKIYENL